jgi:hypothetical protein
MPADLGACGSHACRNGGGRETSDVNELLTISHIIFI